MRKTFLEPELEVVRFGTEDIITTSFVNDGGTEGNIGGGEDTDEWGCLLADYTDLSRMFL